MTRLEDVLMQEHASLILVPGDVNSTMAAALTAAQARMPVAHLEAGLRSHDRSMPEEGNRVLTDHMSDLLLTPTRDADENLFREGIPEQRIAFVGNTMIDSLRAFEAAARKLDVADALNVENFLLVTLHRPSLVDSAERFRAVMEALELIAEERPVVYPIHPRSRRRLEATGWRPQRVRLIEPLGYLRFLSLLSASAAVLTDSGGIQEETTVLGIPCFTLRANTERPITVELGTNTLLGISDSVVDSLPRTLSDFRPCKPVQPEHWDGQAAERVREAVLARFS